MLLPLALCAIPGALAEFESKSGRSCTWFGTSPLCGETEHAIDDVVDGWLLLDTTENYSRAAACYSQGYPSEREPNPCLDDYGEGCVTGYKRLWCQ